MQNYIINLYHDVPSSLYVIMAAIFIIGSLIFLVRQGGGVGIRYSLRLLVIEYVIIMLSSTVFFREERENYTFNYMPFWSFHAISEGREELIGENVMNVVVFIPFGFVLAAAFSAMNCKRCMLIGCLLSVTIETLQLVFRRGFSELDDVMHNTVGCMIGYYAYVGTVKIVNCIKEEKG